ncbi:Sec-independent protein translocase subunit TatA [Actinocorallia sp. A-T 12471]|uniref:Sec-independent protein translocase subunit TatA n=1 Tax=Actinocorallia sp. A-T 12471 TaxID=3089813 RepID=UPI0029CB71B4|nr:Sec-independent protein translocase subunit TatA [Actinocorallia sp. A-T 12471]MDX6744267.1 Sec-independent protein translocase subunit TatA [Actinocorallia sp. A-T 12471]
MPNLGWPELLLIAVVVLVLFGTKKMPDAARSLGRSLRIFKSETKGLVNDDKDDVPAQPQAAPAQEIPAPKADGTTISGVPVSPDQVNRTS